MINPAYVIFISPSGRERTVFSSSDPFLKAMLIFPKILAAFRPGHPESESTQPGTDWERSRGRSSKMQPLLPVAGSRQWKVRSAHHSPHSLLGPRGGEDCLKREKIWVAQSIKHPTFHFSSSDDLIKSWNQDSHGALGSAGSLLKDLSLSLSLFLSPSAPPP